jgi:hypothetical protein
MSFRRIILFIVCTLFLAGTNLPSEAATDVKSDSVKAGTKEKKSSTPKKTASNTKKKKKHKKKAEPKPEDVARHYPPPGSSGEDRNFDWYRKRAFPNEYIDPAAYTNALEEAKKLPVYRLEGRQNGQSNTDWQLLGPSKIGGRVTALATHPTDPNTFYVGSAAGGVWKTTDHGTTWKALTDNFSAISVGCITIDPHDANTVYIGMGECNNSADSYP